jgi:hypothetical protein
LPKEITALFKEVYIMNMYEMLVDLEDRDNVVGVSPLSYVSLGCGR